jgi:tRNA nucleotidyltransferase (CCA-adding enzyme)
MLSIFEKLKNMRVSEVMTTPVVCSSPDSSAHDILKKLENCNFSGLPIVDDKAILGIVSEKDIIQLFLQGKNLRAILAKDFMEPNVITADKNSYVLPSVKALIENQILRLPITYQGRLVGILTRNDILKIILDTNPEFSIIP